jgi:Fe-S oxidoreductase
LRTEQARSTGAEIVATACPYCKIMLDDGLKHFQATDEMAAKDIAELLEARVSAAVPRSAEVGVGVGAAEGS